MNKQKFDMLKVIEGCEPEKGKFLANLLKKANAAYDEAVSKDAFLITGSLDMDYTTESPMLMMGEKRMGTQRTSNSTNHMYIHEELRDMKTIDEVDWSWTEK